MPLAKDFKKGMVIDIDGSPCAIERLEVKTPSARGSATLYKVRARDLSTGSKVDKSFTGTDHIPEADFERRSVQYLYCDGTDYHFMDEETADQFSLPAEALGEQVNYLVENMGGLQSYVHNGEPIAIQLPSTVESEIVETAPAMKGSSATGRTKPATLATGLVVQVPEYLSQGEMIRVDTETGQFVARADSR